MRIREQDTQHNTQQERIQPTNSNAHAHSRTRHAAQHTTRENTTHQLKRTCPSRGLIYQQHKQLNRRQQFPRPMILTPDDDHNGRNM
jgi:hypothetical protein